MLTRATYFERVSSESETTSRSFANRKSAFLSPSISVSVHRLNNNRMFAIVLILTSHLCRRLQRSDEQQSLRVY